MDAIMMNVLEVAEAMGVSKAYAYKVIQKLNKELPYLIVKSSDAHKTHRTGTRSSGRSSGQAAII